MKEKKSPGCMPPGMGWRVALSIITLFGFIIFIILWLFFYAQDYSIYQNIAMVIVSVLVFVAIMGAAWAPWGMKQGHEMEKKRPARKK